MTQASLRDRDPEQRPCGQSLPRWTLVQQRYLVIEGGRRSEHADPLTASTWAAMEDVAYQGPSVAKPLNRNIAIASASTPATPISHSPASSNSRTGLWHNAVQMMNVWKRVPSRSTCNLERPWRSL